MGNSNKSTMANKLSSIRYYNTAVKDVLYDVTNLSDLYYLSVLIGDSTSSISELPLILGSEAFLKLIEYYGGSEIYIPDKYSVQNNLLGVMGYYYYDIRGYSWEETMKKVGLPSSKGNSRLLSNRVANVKDKIRDLKIPSVLMSDAQHETEDKIVGSTKESTMVRLESGYYLSGEHYNEVVKSVLSKLTEDGYLTEDQESELLDEYKR